MDCGVDAEPLPIRDLAQLLAEPKMAVSRAMVRRRLGWKANLCHAGFLVQRLSECAEDITSGPESCQLKKAFVDILDSTRSNIGNIQQALDVDIVDAHA